MIIFASFASNKGSFDHCVYDVLHEAALENVIYIEVRFAPELSMDMGLTVAETIDAVCPKAYVKLKNLVARPLVVAMCQSDQELTARILMKQMKLKIVTLLVL